MPVLATFTFAGAASMASGVNCFAHNLPTTPDWAYQQGIGNTVSSPSLPVHLITRASTCVIWGNPNGVAINNEMVAQFVHAIGR